MYANLNEIVTPESYASITHEPLHVKRREKCAILPGI